MQTLHASLEEIAREAEKIGDVKALTPQDRTGHRKLYLALSQMRSSAQELRWQLLNFKHILEPNEVKVLEESLEKLKGLLSRKELVSSMGSKTAAGALLSFGYLAASHSNARKADEAVETLRRMLDHMDGHILMRIAQAVEIIAHSHHKNLRTHRLVISGLNKLAEGRFQPGTVFVSPVTSQEVRRYAQEALIALFEEPREPKKKSPR